MVASEQCDSVGMFDFEQQKQKEGFDGMVASVHEVPDEDKGGVRQFAC